LAGRTPKNVQHLAVNSMKTDRTLTIADLSNINFLIFNEFLFY
jgi:hypothetical protein